MIIDDKNRLHISLGAMFSAKFLAIDLHRPLNDAHKETPIGLCRIAERDITPFTLKNRSSQEGAGLSNKSRQQETSAKPFETGSWRLFG